MIRLILFFSVFLANLASLKSSFGADSSLPANNAELRKKLEQVLSKRLPSNRAYIPSAPSVDASIKTRQAVSSVDRKRLSRELAEKYAPYVIFSDGEKFFPCSVDWFIKRSRLVKVEEHESTLGPLITGAAKVKELVPFGKVTEQDLIKPKWNDREVVLDLMGNRETYKGMPLVDNASPAPVYCRVIYDGPNKVILQYWFVYAYNGPFSPVSIAGHGPFGIHEGDCEGIGVFLQKVDNQWRIASIYLARHGRERGELLEMTSEEKSKEAERKEGNPTPLEFYEGTHPIIYAAKFGHASYPTPQGWLPTSDGDLVSKSKYYWFPSKNVVLIDDQTPWNQFKGRFGLAGGGPRPPSDKGFYESYPTDKEGNLTRQIPFSTLKEIEGIHLDAKKPILFSLDISTHYLDCCWGLYKKQRDRWVLSQDVDFDVMEERKFPRGDKKWYSIRGGSDCVKLTMYPRTLKNFYIRLSPEATTSLPGEYKLVIRGRNP